MTALDRALDVMEYVNERGAVRVGDLCLDLKLPRPTAHRLLSLLEQRGYVRHDPSTHLYAPGPGILRLAARRAVSSLVQCSEPALVRLREETRETVNLGVVQGGRIVYASTLDGLLMPRMSAGVGEDVPPHATAIGKAVLAALSEKERSRFLGREPYPVLHAKDNHSAIKPGCRAVLNYRARLRDRQRRDGYGSGLCSGGCTRRTPPASGRNIRISLGSTCDARDLCQLGKADCGLVRPRFWHARGTDGDSCHGLKS